MAYCLREWALSQPWGSAAEASCTWLPCLGQPTRHSTEQTHNSQAAERQLERCGDADVQKAIARHHAHIEQFYPAPAEVYRGLGQLYVEHKEFRAFYDKYRLGLAGFMQAAMEYIAITA